MFPSLLVVFSEKLFCSGFAFGGFGSCFGSCFGGFFGCGSCCSGDFGFLFSYFFGLSFVLGYFSVEAFFESELFLVGHRSFNFVYRSGFLRFPCFKTTLCLGFVECAFLDTALEMFHQEDAFVRKD